MRCLLAKGESEIEAFFSSVGLSSEYQGPAPGWGRQRRILAALTAAERRGDIDHVLDLVADMVDIASRREAGVPAGQAGIANGAEPAWAGGVGGHASPGAPGTGPADPAGPAEAVATVFVVHGRRRETRLQVARLIDRVGRGRLEAVILDEQPNVGLTVIEKLERLGRSAAYAVVLLTADDVGGLAVVGPVQGRARQNVVLELGYFMGAIGRGRVALLAEPEVEWPSDVGGVIHIELDGAGAWKHRITAEMHAAGLAVDFTRIV